MNLTLAAIEKNRITVVFLAVILLSGTLSFFDMERAEDPGFQRGQESGGAVPGAANLAYGYEEDYRGAHELI